jgi:hypothetical protein
VCGLGVNTPEKVETSGKKAVIEAAIIIQARQVVQKTNFIHICTSFARALRGWQNRALFTPCFLKL